MQHQWKVERPSKTSGEINLVCLECGLLQLPENKDGECVPSKAWTPKQLEIWDD